MNVTRTRSDLIHAVLAKLGVLSTGQPVESDDYNAVDTYVDGLVNELAARGVCYVADSGEQGAESSGNIPAEWFDALSICLTDAASAEFGAAGQFYQARFSEDANNPGAEMRLREMTRGRPTYQTLRTMYF